METQIKIAAKMYEARDQLRRLLGDKYLEKINPIKEHIVKNSEPDKHLSFALAVCKSTDNPTIQWHIMAAVVEIYEPTEGGA